MAQHVVSITAHEVTAEPIKKLAGIIGYRFVCACGRRGDGHHRTAEKARRAGHDHIPGKTYS